MFRSSMFSLHLGRIYAEGPSFMLVANERGKFGTRTRLLDRGPGRASQAVTRAGHGAYLLTGTARPEKKRAAG